MAPTLKDFNTKEASMQELRMDAFQPALQPSPAANQATINTIASYGAALDLDGQIDSVYTSIANQLSYSPDSETLDNVVGKWRQADIQGSMDTMRNILVNPDIPDNDKQEILYNWQTNQQVDPLAYNVGVSAVMADDVENGEQSDLRARIGEAYNDVVQFNSWSQKQINALNSEQNPAWHDSVKTLIESFIPFTDAADQAFFENALNAGEGGVVNTVQTLLLLGEGRERLRVTLARMPIQERQAVVQNMINTLRATSGSIAGDAHTLKQIANLERMITPGGYSDTERWADNVFSILDDTILLSPVTRGLRNIGNAIRGTADEARVAAEMAGVAERSAANIEPLPRNQSLAIITDPAIPSGNITGDIDNVIDSLPIEPTGREINDLRSVIMKQLDNPNGFDIDAVINEVALTDKLTSEQIGNLRGQIGVIRDKRTQFLNAKPTTPPPTIEHTRARHISSNVQPTAVAPIYKDTNVGKARAAHNVVLADETDNAAQKLYGTTRQNALAHDYLPEIGGNGRVANKVEYDEASSTPDVSILKHVENSRTTSWADAAEKAEAQKAVIDDFKNTIGITNRSAMASIEDLGIGPTGTRKTTIISDNPEIAKNLKDSLDKIGAQKSSNTPSGYIKTTDNGVRINQVYGPKDGGFSNAFTAVDTVRAALRKYGVADNELTILSRQQDGTYAPLSGSQRDLTNGDFLVQVKYDYNFDPKDVNFSGYDVSPLWGFLRIPDLKLLNSEGGVTQQFIPKSANIDPRAFIPGVAAADKAGGIQRQFLKEADKFGKDWQKLPKEQQVKVDHYIRKANDEEIPFNVGNIKGMGISDEGVEVLRRWKSLQDTLGYLENADLARTLRDRGFEMFEHRGTDTRLLVKTVPKSNVPTNAEIYDVSTDSFIIFSQKNIDELYEKGGSIVTPRRAEVVNGRSVDYILNSGDGNGFARRIRDDDRILGYRHGYYHVKYTDPFYITKRDPKTGKVSVISRAEGNRDARIEVQRLNDTRDGFEYSYKKDREDEAFDNHVDVAVNTGRSAQRIRGKRLERVGGANDKTISDAGMESPSESLTRSIASISNRVAFRNVIDAEKKRWMSQFKSLVNTQDGYKFPVSVDDIKDGPGANEARHAFRHIQALQDGYVNRMDDLSKWMFSTVSEVAGAKGWGWVDKLAAKAAKVSPSAAARLTAFKLFLAANPIRQLPLQALPAVAIISSLNPTGWGKVIKQMGIVGAWHRGVDLTVTEKVAKYGLNMQETRDMLEAYELSGISAAVNSHSFRSDQMGRLADRNAIQQAATFLGKPLKVAQTVGFDLGEQTLMSLTWLSEYDRMTRALKRTKLTGSERDQLMAKVRALTGDMNRGGDMPYNSNTFSVIMQFMQTPHKIASGLILGHRGLTGAERAKMAAGYTVAFGVPGVPAANWFIDQLLPDADPETRDILKGGMTNLLLNKALTALSGEETRVDFSDSLQPFTLDPMIEFAGNLISMNMGEFASGTAAISLFAEDGRINRFIRSVVDWTIPGEYEGVDEAKQIGLTFMQMFSGVSNTMKALQIQEMGKITTATGQTVDEDVSYMETLMKAAGFSTMDEVDYWAGNKAKWEIDGSRKKDVEYLVDSLFAKYTREGYDVADMEQYTKILRAAGHHSRSSQGFIDQVSDYYKFKMRQNPQALYRLLLNSNLYTGDEVQKIINQGNFSQEQRDVLTEMYNIAGE